MNDTIIKQKEKVEVIAIVNWVGHWKNEGDRGNLIREVANEYEFVNQEIQVKLSFPEDLYNADDAREVAFIIEQMQKPVAEFDIIRIKEHYVNIARQLNDPFWGKKYLVDFSDVEGFKERHIDFINNPEFSKRTGGILLSPYNEGQFWALYLNLNVAKKMGIEVKQYGMTFDDFLSYIKAAHQYNKENPNNYIAPIFEDFYWISTEAIFNSLAYSLNGNYSSLNTSMNMHKFEAIEKSLQALEQLAQFEPIIRNRSKISWERDNGYPLQDSCLFFVNGSWMFNIWKMKDAEKMNNIIPCELPVFQPIDYCMGGYASNWAILKNAPHRDQAIKLMMYWTRPEIAEKWARYTKCPSGIKGNLTNTSFGVDEYENFMYTIESKYEGRKAAQGNFLILGEKNAHVPIPVVEILEKRITANEAIRRIKSQLIFDSPR